MRALLLLLTVVQAPTIEVTPASMTLEVGASATLRAVIHGSDAQVVFFSGNRMALTVTPSGRVTANRPGTFVVTALLPDKPFDGAWDSYSRRDPGIRTTIEVTVPDPPLESIAIVGFPSRMYAGTTLPIRARGTDTSGAERTDFTTRFLIDDIDTDTDAQTAETDGFGNVTALAPGSFTITADADGVSADHDVNVIPNPTASLTLTASSRKARTGDVVRFEASALSSAGERLEYVPIAFALSSRPDPNRPESVGAGAPAQIDPLGRFVAEQPGIYTIVAMSGDRMARASVLVTPRNVAREIEFLGHARVSDRITADLWVWEGIDGRDYAVHGTWNAEGHAYFYDVTDPTDMKLIDTVQVDARTVNDVKVSEDGRTCIISREGASNRRNGFVLLDVSDPHNVEILSTFDDGLTGGVHNVFIHEDHVYAVNNGRRWDVVNVEDPRNPFRVSRFETKTPGRSVHDVWVRDGIAYQAGRSDGLIVVDVGGGGMGGSPTSPVEMGKFPQITGWNHAVWPFKSKSADRFYVVGGDEAFYTNPIKPEGGGILWKEQIPSHAKGWLHFVEFDDMNEPHEVARYQLPDSGPHNLWIDWDEEIMYVAHYDAGLRIVDISGELLGDLYRQGREIGRFFSTDNEGFLANAPFAWGPQPHKGTIFFADFNSGLWAIRLAPSDKSTDGEE